ncbi:hypothetical protein P280DRAFT_466659 [Massarina eburnea CBS 473.64]|uniref:Zn(2)-C6 fungal-type domain-containing protein n=1 Tax=Massarina eburnea CBS 473.64 TaxID=1395130 RepID=A0A6A6SBZ5_9PLEO|nr:hypothetical protein P280DRAFT_466659 [Massarina eburnea CBS 473.64]
MVISPSDTSDSILKKNSEQQLNRACEACRTSKVRCLPHPGSSTQCQRCTKAGRLCIFAAPAKRRQRKRTDVRVAELEREVRQLTSLLRPNSNPSISPEAEAEADISEDSMDEDEEQHAEPEERTTPTIPRKEVPKEENPAKLSATWTQWSSSVRLPPIANANDCSTPDLLQPSAPYPGQDPLQPTEKDILERGIITEELAEELLNLYRDELVPQYPAVLVPEDWTVQDLRSKKPALFHAVMAAASHSKGATLSNKLHEEIIYYYARCLFIRGDKGIQWIQALYVTVSYYTPPNHPNQMQIYQYGNIAASMAMELGLASKPRTHEQLPKRAIRSLQKISTTEELLENCRTILALYTMTAGLGVRLRRPNILLFNSWMEECQVILSQSPLLHDKRIVAWLRLQRIADEAYTAFGFDDASTSFTLSELRLQAILKMFEKRMREWKQSVPDEVWTESLKVEFHQNMMSMWEFGMDGGRYDAPEFRNRHLTLPALDDEITVQPETLLSRSALQVSATIMCISAAHSVLDHVTSIPVRKLQKAPGVVFVRSIFALVVLLRADYAIGTDAEGMGEYLDSKNLKIDYYLDALMNITKESIGPQKCRIPSHWLFVLKEKIGGWHAEHMTWRKEGKHLARNKKTRSTITTAGGVAPQNTETSQTYTTPPEVPVALSSIRTSSSASSAHTGSGSAITTSSSTPTSTSTRPHQPPPPPPPPQQQQQQQQQPHQQQQQQQQPHQQHLPSGQQPLPDFNNFTTPFPWPAQTRLNNQSNNGFAGTGTGSDLMDFSAAFSNGDLYLWNDMADNFGGWIPQGGSMYSDAQFGGLGGQGF